MNRSVLLIVGPTAVGKTALSIEVAKRLGGEIISADSRQVYRYMDIGTAKPTRDELTAVPHHFIDHKTPDEYYSAGEYATEARACIRVLFERGVVPIVVGGSGLYLRALVDGLAGPGIADEEVKQALKAAVREKGLGVLFDELRAVDPVTAGRLHATDTQRILRALEVYRISGRPFSALVSQEEVAADFAPVFVGLTMARERLYRRIEERAASMIEQGLVEEARRLQDLGYGSDLNSLQTVGYKEAFDFLDGYLTRERMTVLIKQKTRNYAKRQITWFRKEKRIQWLDQSDSPDSHSTIAQIGEIFSTSST